jgi:hypothetical protein
VAELGENRIRGGEFMEKGTGSRDFEILGWVGLGGWKLLTPHFQITRIFLHFRGESNGLFHLFHYFHTISNGFANQLLVPTNSFFAFRFHFSISFNYLILL